MNSPPHTTNFNVNLNDNNMDYIPEQPDFEATDVDVPRSPTLHVEKVTLHQTLCLCLLRPLLAQLRFVDQKEKISPWS